MSPIEGPIGSVVPYRGTSWFSGTGRQGTGVVSPIEGPHGSVGQG